MLFDKATYDKLYKEVPNYKLITPAVVSERLKIRGSLARNALQELLAKGELLFSEKMLLKGGVRRAMLVGLNSRQSSFRPTTPIFWLLKHSILVWVKFG